VTIPRFIKGVKDVAIRGAFYPELLSEAVTAITQLGLTATEPVKVGEVSITPRDFITAYAESIEDIFRIGVEPCSGTWVEVRGHKGGKPTKYTYRAADRMYKQTGVPASIGAQMLARGDIKTKGVLAPEACIEPEPFFAELAKRDIAVYETEQTTTKL
jgi:saccharopine dehydrogenase (NAD+, L-lysine-forming)